MHLRIYWRRYRSRLVMLRYIEISIRYRYIVPYRIARGNIGIFDIPMLTFWFIILPNFHVWCQEVVKFSQFTETFIETFTVTESFNENFTTSWHHTWKFGKRITEFFIVRKFRKILRKFRKILHYNLVVRISKAVISYRGQGPLPLINLLKCTLVKH